MKIKLNGPKSTDTLYENAPLHKAVSIITSKRLSALPVIDEQGKFVGIIGVGGLLEMLLPQSVRTALSRHDDDSVPSLSFMDDNMEELHNKLDKMSETPVGKLAKRDAPVIYPDSPVMEAVLLLLRGEDDVAMIERDTRKFICMVSALDLLHTLNEGTHK
jgi:CBS-domain-containing membrane protein